MNEDTLYDVCDALGLGSGSAYTGGDKWGPHSSISCPMAPLKHGDPYDWNLSCSVSLSDDEPSLARCFSFNCGYKGSFYTMLVKAVEARGNPQPLVDLLKRLEPTEKFTLESSLARSKKRHDAAIEKMRRPVLIDKDRDVLPEGRVTRYQSCIPGYAITRGLTIEACKHWGLGFDKGNGRLVFPVRRHDGKLIGITGRALPSALAKAEAKGVKVAKYHNYAGLDKTRYLFGEHLLKVGEPIILCEGQIDAIITWQHLGIPTVAVLGQGFSSHHVKTLASFEPPVVYLFPDYDQAGKMAAEKFEYALHGRMPLKLMLPPEGMDPGELTKDEADEALLSAHSVFGKINWKEIQKISINEAGRG